MSNEAKIRELFGEASLQYVKNKNRGGSNNEKGNIYENSFSIYKLVTLTKEVIENQQDVRFSSQIFTYVDDLKIEFRSSNLCQYYQLKNVQELSWGSGEKTLQDDFFKQYQLSTHSGEDAEVYLVVSQEDLCNKLAEKIPDEIAPFSDVQCFRYFPSLTQAIYENPDFKQAIEYLCAIENPEPDKIECVAVVLLGAWRFMEKSDLSLLAVLEKAKTSTPNFIRSLGVEEIQLEAEVKAILDAIKFFSYRISRGFFHWEFFNGLQKGDFRCDTAKFRRFTERIKQYQPETFIDDLENLL